MTVQGIDNAKRLEGIDTVYVLVPITSGSPVVNLRGQLVAINYAGINGTQNFNYGVRVKYLRELLNK